MERLVATSRTPDLQGSITDPQSLSRTLKIPPFLLQDDPLRHLFRLAPDLLHANSLCDSQGHRLLEALVAPVAKGRLIQWTFVLGDVPNCDWAGPNVSKGDAGHQLTKLPNVARIVSAEQIVAHGRI